MQKIAFFPGFPNQFLVDPTTPYLMHEKSVLEAWENGNDLEILSIEHGWIRASKLYGSVLQESANESSLATLVAGENPQVSPSPTKENRGRKIASARESGDRSATREVIDIYRRSHLVRGNLIPLIWLHQLRLNQGPDFPACFLLAEIIRWFHPKTSSSTDGKPESLKRQFWGDTLQKSWSDLQEDIGISRDQLKRALRVLEDFRLISRDKRTVVYRGHASNNVLYIHIHTDVIALLDLGKLNPLGVLKPHPRWTKTPRSERRYTDIYINDALMTTSSDIQNKKKKKESDVLSHDITRGDESFQVKDREAPEPISGHMVPESDQGRIQRPEQDGNGIEDSQPDNSVGWLEQVFSQRLTRQEEKKLREHQEFGRFTTEWCEAFCSIAQEFRDRKTTWRRYKYFVPRSMKYLLEQPELTEMSACSMCRDLVGIYESEMLRKREDLMVANACSHLPDYGEAAVANAEMAYRSAELAFHTWEAFLPILSRQGTVPEHDYVAAKAPYPGRISSSSDDAAAYNERFYAAVRTQGE